jgi:hypothetical protein
MPEQKSLFINLIQETGIYILQQLPEGREEFPEIVKKQFNSLVEKQKILPRNSKKTSGIKLYNGDVENQADGSVDAVVKIMDDGGWRVGCKVYSLKIKSGTTESIGIVYIPAIVAPKKEFKAYIKNSSSNENNAQKKDKLEGPKNERNSKKAK